MRKPEGPSDFELLRAVYRHLDREALRRELPSVSTADVKRLFQRVANELGAANPGKLQRAILYTDGGSQGNPGPAACACVLQDGAGNTLRERASYLGRATSNVAEYRALLLGLEAARELGAGEVQVRTDSELLAKQISGAYKVRHSGLKPLHAQVMEALSRFAKWQVRHIPRGQNKRADALVRAEINARKAERS